MKLKKLKESRPIFLYDNPHYFHDELGKVISAKNIHYANKYKGGLLLSQINSIFTKTPDSELYLVESPRCLLPAIKKKIKNPNVKIVCINSDTFFYDFSRYNKIVKNICMWYLKHVDYFLSTSKYMIELAKKQINTPHMLVYPYVDKKNFENVFVDLTDTDVSSIGNACNFRGGDLLIDFSIEHNIPIRIIGRPAELSRFHRSVASYPGKKPPILPGYDEDYFGFYKPQIEITGRVEHENIPLLLSGTYINPSRHDSFGINVLESMICGIPPIVTEGVGAKELLPKELICKTSVKSIYDRYKWLNSNMRRKKVLGMKCREIALKFTKLRSLQMFNDELKSKGLYMMKYDNYIGDLFVDEL